MQIIWGSGSYPTRMLCFWGNLQGGQSSCCSSLIPLPCFLLVGSWSIWQLGADHQDWLHRCLWLPWANRVWLVVVDPSSSIYLLTLLLCFFIAFLWALNLFFSDMMFWFLGFDFWFWIFWFFDFSESGFLNLKFLKLCSGVCIFVSSISQPDEWLFFISWFNKGLGCHIS